MAAKKSKKPEIVPRRATVAPAEIDRMLAVLVHNPNAYAALAGVLDANILARRYRPHARVWRLLQEHVNEFNELPGSGTLRTAINASLDDGNADYTEEEIETLNELMEYVFDPAEHDEDIVDSPTCVSLAVATCQLLIQEEAAFMLQETLIQGDSVIADLPAMLTSYNKTLAMADALGADEVRESFEEDWDRNDSAKLTPCGVDILDRYMGGGWLPGECLIFMGPFGSCKTLLTVDGVCTAVCKAAEDYLATSALEPDAPRPVVFLIFTEGTKKDYQKRLVSNMAQVPWSKLNQMRSIADLSDSDKPGDKPETEYEKHLTLAKNAAFENEQTRVRKASAIMNRHLVLIDCTTSNEQNQGRLGAGGVPAIVAVVTRYLDTHPDCYPLAFWLDHASALAARVIEGTEEELSRRLQLVLKDIPRLFKERLAVPYKAPVAIMHQLRGQANAFGSTANLTHADAADCKSFAEYADFAFTTTRPDDKNVCIFRCTKHRRMPPLPLTLVQVDGRFNHLHDANGKYSLLAGAHKIVAIEDMKKHTGNQLVTELPVAGDDDDETILNQTEMP